MDSSSDKLDEVVKSYLDRKNISYIKYDSSKFFANKIADGCQSITTPYAVLCADDDFLIPKGIIEGKNFLKENIDFASAHGLYFNHTSSEVAQKHGFSIGPLYQNGHSSEQDSAEERLNAYLSGETGYYPMYAVHRTDLFQQIWSETKTYVFDWGLSELFPCALSFIHGKMKVLPVFYSSREPNTYTWFDETRLRKMYSEEKIKIATSGLANHLYKFANIDKGKSHDIATRALNTYLCRLEKKMIIQKNEQLSTRSQIRKKIGLRTRIQKILFNGCHTSIHPEFKSDYIELMQSVIRSNLEAEKLNRSRRKFAVQAS